MAVLTSLTLRDFRNLGDQTWEPAAGVNLVYGGNGAGKSSLLEAIYLVGTTRSFRTPRLADVPRLGRESFFVGADTEGEERARLEVSWDAQSKHRSLNGRSGPITDHVAALPIVFWTTRENEIFQGPPAVRRRLMDRGIVLERAASLACLSDYRRALEAKRAALESRSPALEEWNRMLARTGAELARRRSRWVSRLEASLAAVLARSRLELGPVELTYRPSPSESLEGEEALFEEIERRSRREIERRRVLLGPHRDELEFSWRHGSVGRMASAGERKLLGLALMVAQSDLLVERRSAPLWMVDDLDAELDRERVDQIWELLAEECQVIAATSRKEVVSELPADAKWSLESGILAGFAKDSPGGL